MALFKRKNKEVAETVEEPVIEEVELTEEEQHARQAQTVMELAKVYTVLSAPMANMMKGLSVPQLFLTEDKRSGLAIFSKPEYAKAYIDRIGYEKLDGQYLIGELSVKGDEKPLEPTLGVALAISLAMGASFIDYNVGANDGSFGCSLPWFMNVNKISRDVAILTTKEEAEALKNDESKKLKLRFNACRIYQFDYKYDMNEIVSKNILDRVFKASNEDEIINALEKEDLFELCHTMNMVKGNFLPKAQKEHPQDVARFNMIIENGQKIVKSKVLEEEVLYYLTDFEKGELLVKNGMSYLLYTDRFKYMGKNKYNAIKPDEAFEFFKSKGINQIIVTDGPHGMAFIEI